jgi:hypothetical protein
MTKRVLKLLLGVVLVTVNVSSGGEWDSGFRTPPPEARPWVYGMWMDGNVSREGITADFEAMQRAGIGGVIIMEVDRA